MLISIVVPVYNVEKYLTQCLKSIQMQSYKNFEVILINDGSTDNSLSICNHFCLSDSRFRVFSKCNAGQGIARNFGVSRANGELITFVDSDDYLESNYLINLILPFKENNNLDLVIGGYKKVDSDGKIFYEEVYVEGEILNSQLSLRMLGSLPNREDSIKGTVWNALYRTDVIKKNKIEFFSEREFFSEDTLFNLNYLENSGLSYLVPNSSYCYRLNLSSTSTKFDSQKLKLINEYYTYITSLYNTGDEAKLRISKIYLHNLKRVLFQEKRNPSNHSFRDVNRNISSILQDETVKKVLNYYPIFKHNDLKSIFIFICCKYKFSLFLSFLLWNNIGRNKKYIDFKEVDK
ncbi:glycosyltransferase family 2 protein [Streptococcus gallolyticus]|uniref:glycosyltransferase family 2 protein n=2 Tax=Streptococcus gallolyticus TaxID=315405 RepID=UPI0022851942|nr:glycosyltransferase family 2 protein [Streptococcus gallolyticus]MCY7189569.1 glycosyltransferase family 2 protein [Streptococcus gallolyticus subsp. gallolyticus]